MSASPGKLLATLSIAALMVAGAISGAGQVAIAQSDSSGEAGARYNQPSSLEYRLRGAEEEEFVELLNQNDADDRFNDLAKELREDLEARIQDLDPANAQGFTEQTLGEFAARERQFKETLASEFHEPIDIKYAKLDDELFERAARAEDDARRRRAEELLAAEDDRLAHSAGQDPRPRTTSGQPRPTSSVPSAQRRERAPHWSCPLATPRR